MSYLNDLESAWRGEHDMREGQIRGLQTATRDASRHASRMASAGDPMMNGFAVRDAMQYADQAAQREAQALGSYNSWAAGREVQHERNLQNAAAATNQYNAETARMESNNKLAGTQALANSVAGMGYGLGGIAGGAGGGNSASIGLYGNNGQQIGGGSVLGGLVDHPQQQQQQQQQHRRR